MATLVHHGAQVNAVDKFDKLPLNYVENRTEPEAVSIGEFLRENGARSTWRTVQPVEEEPTHTPQLEALQKQVNNNESGWKSVSVSPKTLTLTNSLQKQTQECEKEEKEVVSTEQTVNFNKQHASLVFEVDCDTVIDTLIKTDD